MKMRLRSFVPILLTSALMAAAEPNFMPVPAQYTLGQGRLIIGEKFTVALTGYKEPRLEAAAQRIIRRLAHQTGILAIDTLGGIAPDPSQATLVIKTGGPSKPVQELGEDESYELTVDSKQARVQAANPLGAMHGLETFLQLVTQDRDGFAAPAITISDKPRFAWRGLHIDVSRHWMPIDVIKRNLDAMAAVKLNVFHWHLSDDQGFRVESKRYPKLQELGSDGNYYTQAQIREMVEYARNRGIRVIPEFDVPGHATAILAAYPELASAPGPYQIERKWGVFDPTLDPTNEQVYTFLDGLIGEMSQLFPDRYFHIGGDEVNGKQWSASARIQAFMREHGIKNNHELQRYFNRRLQPIVTKYGKRMEGWDEILDPDLPKDIVIQSWRGQKSLAEAARMGYAGILSAPYYLDLIRSTSFHYLADPIDESAAALTPEQRALILGGEACMWSEYVTPENIDGRIWPRMAAIAERFWSPQAVRDLDSMYRRLAVVSRNLEWTGVTHRTAYERMLARLAYGDPVQPVRTLVEVIEPVKGYARGRTGQYTQFTPLNRAVDTALPESMAAYYFRKAIEAKDRTAIRRTLMRWRDNDAALRPMFETHPLLTDTAPVSETLSRVAAIGLEALDAIEFGKPLAADRIAQFRAALDSAKKPVGPMLLMAVDPIAVLVDAAGGTH